jgi:choline kinase
LLQPANEHKQLVVIDFEYAAANLPGLEFANHFTEWTYNYHDPVAPFACNTDRYPSVDQQRRFLKAYLEHVPQFGRSSASTTSPNDTPLATPTTGTPMGTPGLHSSYSSSSIVEFMLDARVPPGGWKEEEKRQAEASEQKLVELMDETRLWRIANSAQWVAWGIIQAKVPGLVAASTPRSEDDANTPPPASAGAAEVVTGTQRNDDELERRDETQEGNTSGEHDFDYLAYAQDRALFFWGDCVLMGLVKLEELPEGLRKSIKLVDR